MTPSRGARAAVRRAFSAAIAIAALLALSSVARALGLTTEERAALDRGEVVKRELAFDLDEGRYVGGVAYVIIQAPVRDVMSALVDIGSYTSILPLAVEARTVGARGRDRLVTLKHRTRVSTAGYTVRVRRAGPAQVRFWLDKSFPADVDDCWGFFRVARVSKDTSLLTYGAVMNLGFGIARLFFESKIQGYALTTPELVRRYVESGGAAKRLPPR